MTENEVIELLVMLKQFYPNKKIANKRCFLDAWALALEPYAYEDVKAAAAEYAARNKYFPDLSDLTAGLTPVRKQSVDYGKDDSALMRKLLDNAKAANEVV